MRPECSARCPRLPANPRLLLWARKLPQECSSQIIAPKDSAPASRSPLPGAPSPLTLRGARQAFEMAVLRGLPRTARAALAWAQCVQLGVPRASHPLLSLARTPACPQPAASGSRLRVSGFPSPPAPATVPPRVCPCKPSARDETCPVGTEGWTRRVHFVREGGGGRGATLARRPAEHSYPHWARAGGGGGRQEARWSARSQPCSSEARRPRGSQLRRSPPPFLVLSGHAASFTPY